MALIHAALITWTEYKAAFNISDNSEQEKYETLINEASARIELYCKQNLKARQYNDVRLDGYGRKSLVLPCRPVNYISELAILDGNNKTVLESSEYEVENHIGIIYSNSIIFPARKKCITITYNAGYNETHSEMVLLKSACKELTRWMAIRYAGQIGKRSETNADGMSVGYEIDIPVNIKGMLDYFREPL